jgi:predicted nucleotide-binding protein (sugar kinase/HSP70/actin superfamily)
VQAGKVLRKFTVAQCERGRTGDERGAGETIAQRGARPPNFIEISNKTMFSARISRRVSSSFQKVKSRRRKSLESAVIGIPQVLNVHSTAPFFKSYFEHLGAGDVRFSSHTSDRLYKHTLGRGSIDPCFPSKIAVSHVYGLLNGDWIAGRRAAGDRVTHIFFPCIRTLRGEVHAGDPHWSCPVVSATPEVVKASLTLEKDEFAERGVRYLDPVLDMAERDILERQMYEALGPVFHIGRRENREAIEKALKDWGVSLCALREKAEETLLELERTNGTGIVVLARPYHNDPGINHGILERLNRRGYAIFSIESLPRTGRTVERLFGRELESGAIEHPLDVREEWPRCYSENTSLKVWATRFAARHPNLVALDLSSFRCGHDAPLYSVIDDIFRKEASPYFTFHEIDENKPIGSIKLRVETIDYFLGRRGSCHDRRHGVRSISRYNLRLDRTQGRHTAPVPDREGMQCLQSSSAV